MLREKVGRGTGVAGHWLLDAGVAGVLEWDLVL